MKGRQAGAMKDRQAGAMGRCCVCSSMCSVCYVSRAPGVARRLGEVQAERLCYGPGLTVGSRPEQETAGDTVRHAAGQSDRHAARSKEEAPGC